MRLIKRCVAQSRLISIINSGSVLAMPRGQPRPLSQHAQRTQPSATISAVPMTTPSAPSAMAFITSQAVRAPPLTIKVTPSRMPSATRNLCTLAMAYSSGMAMFFLAMSGAAPVPP
jgi:hypothetical protein